MTPTSHDADTPAVPSRREGFALPLAIVVMAILTMGLIVGLSTTSSEMATTLASRSQARAYSYAQMGLEAFLLKRKEKSASGVQFCPDCWAKNSTHPANTAINATLDTLPTQRETVYVAYSGGGAVVRATPVWLDLARGRGTYFVTSTGTDDQGVLGAALGKTVKATRTVGVFVTWSSTTMNVVGAWTSLTGIVKNGTGVISGVDQSGTPCAGSNGNVAGLSVPQYGGHADMNINGNFSPTGNPPYDTTKTFAQESSAVKLDWNGIRNGNLIPADIIITATSGTFPSTGTFSSDTNYWPVIHVMNKPTPPATTPAAFNFSLPNRGRGMLIVDGDLTISGSNQWDGVIMVGGQLTSNGNNVSEGATLSGLNTLLSSQGFTPPAASTADDATANGQKAYTYNSCSVSKATSSMARYTMLPNTWMDDVSGY